jgi:hypothetical protein
MRTSRCPITLSVLPRPGAPEVPFRGTRYHRPVTRSRRRNSHRSTAQVERAIIAPRIRQVSTVGGRVMRCLMDGSTRHSSHDMWRGPERSRPRLSSGVPARGHRSEVPFASGSCAPHQLAIWVPLGRPSLIGPTGLSVARVPYEASSRLFGDNSREPRATLIVKVTGWRLSRRTTLTFSRDGRTLNSQGYLGTMRRLRRHLSLCVGSYGLGDF